MSLFEICTAHFDQQQLIDLGKRKQLLDHCLKVVQQPEFREQILSKIREALESSQCEIEVELQVELIQQPEFRELIISEITQALQFVKCETHISLSEPDKLSEPQTMFSYLDNNPPIHLIIENGQAYTVQLMFMKVGATKIVCDLLIVNC